MKKATGNNQEKQKQIAVQQIIAIQSDSKMSRKFIASALVPTEKGKR